MNGERTNNVIAPPSDGREPPVEPPRPTPLLWPAMAMMGGIWLSESVGERGALVGWAIAALPLIAALALFIALRGRHRRTARVFVLLLAFSAGAARHQAVTYHPPHHVIHALGSEPVLTRVVGDVVSTPTSTPGELRNPFLPFDPPGRTRFVLSLREFRTLNEPAPAGGLIRVSVEAERMNLHLGDRVELTGKLYRPRKPQNLGETDWQRWNYLQRIDAGMSVEGAQYVRLVGENDAWLSRAVAGARSLARALLLGPEADLGADDSGRLLETMVLGRRGAAGRRINEAFLRAGGMHFLAVSGFHVGVLAGAVWLLTRRLLRLTSRRAALITLVVIILYALVAEPNAPILRASIMGVLAALSVMSRRPVNAFNWLALAAICILAFNPLELFRPGFQLSIVLVFLLLGVVPRVCGLVLLTGERHVVYPVYSLAVRRGTRATPPTRDAFMSEAANVPELLVKLAWRWTVGLLALCVVMWTVALPLVMLHFGRIAPFGWLGTFVLTVPVVVAIWLAFLTLLANLFIPPLGTLLAAPLAWTLSAVLALADAFGNLPSATVLVSSPPALAVAGIYAGLLVYVLWWPKWRMLYPRHMLPQERARHDARRRRQKWAVAVTMLAALAYGGLHSTLQQAASDDYCIHALAIGNGSATIVTAPNGEAAVFDCGTDRNFDVGDTVTRSLHALGVQQLQAVSISHANFDHYSGVPTLLTQVPTKRLLLSPYFLPAAGENPAVDLFLRLLPPDFATTHHNSTVQTICANDHSSVGAMRVEVLWPPADLDETWEPNDRSLVFRLHAAGRTVLVTGDIERAVIRALLGAEGRGDLRLTADVLIAPHHGSVLKPDTAALLTAVSPEVVIVSSARTRSAFMNLARDTLGPDVQLMSTSDAGAVTVRITPGGELVIETPFASPSANP